MKKMLLFIAVVFLVSCSKNGQEALTVKPSQIAFSLSSTAPKFFVTVETTAPSKSGMSVFQTRNNRSIFDTFAASAKDTTDTKIIIFDNEIIEATQVKK